MVDNIQHRLMAIQSEVESLKTASVSTPGGMRTVTKTINMNAVLTVYASYIQADYFITLAPHSSDELIYSISQRAATVSDDVIISHAVPRIKNGEHGTSLRVIINYQRQQAYLDQYDQGDTITKAISFKITASDDFEYTITQED